MDRGLDRVIAVVERLVLWFAGLGAVIILIQMVWISYGVFTRYALNAPDRMVTEATALLLFPVAFAGLAYAMREDAYPKVTMLTDMLPPLGRKLVGIMNLTLMAGLNATLSAFNSGSSSEILLWPRWMFWAPGATALVLFSIYTALLLTRLIRTPAQEV